MNVQQQYTLKCFAAVGGKERGWPWMFFPSYFHTSFFFFLSFFHFAFELCLVVFLSADPEWPLACYSHYLNLNNALYSLPPQKRKIFGFVPNFNWGNDMNQISFDLRFRSFVWRFLCFLSSFFALSARVHSDGKYVMCLYVNLDQDFNSVLLHFSHHTMTIHYALVIGNVACRDS